MVHNAFLGIPNPISLVEGLVGSGTGALIGAALNAIAGFVLAGAAAALRATARLIDAITTPHLLAAWFSASYWHVAGLAAMLTVPFLFAAAIQAVLRSDITLLGRAAFVDLPVAGMAVLVAAPLTNLLLAATDEMCAMVSGGAAGDGARFLEQAANAAGAGSPIDGSMFIALFVGMLTVAAAVGLTIELLVRDAAVYVLVLMLPLAFAALVWPARRIWAVRTVELLISLIFAKFVIVAVLSLAAAALADSGGGLSVLLPAMTLILLSTFAPWALLRILPFAEIGAAAHSTVRSGVSGSFAQGKEALSWATGLAGGAAGMLGASAGMLGSAGETEEGAPNLPRTLEAGFSRSGDDPARERGSGGTEPPAQAAPSAVSAAGGGSASAPPHSAAEVPVPQGDQSSSVAQVLADVPPPAGSGGRAEAPPVGASEERPDAPPQAFATDVTGVDAGAGAGAARGAEVELDRHRDIDIGEVGGLYLDDHGFINLGSPPEEE